MAPISPLTKKIVKTATYGLCGLALLPMIASPIAAGGLHPHSPAALKQTFTPPDRGTPDAPITTGTRAFQPRRRGTPDGPSTSTGTRSGSCLNDVDATTGFAGLAPQFETGLTRATRPEFVWYLPESSQAFPVEFRLLTLDDAARLILVHSETNLPYRAGFMSYQMPEHLAALEPGRLYYWQVIVNCNPNRPSRALFSTAPFEVVPPSAELTESLATADTTVERALAHADDGLWYDALALVVRGETAAEQQLRTQLLRDLAYEEANSDNGDEQLSTALTQIADETDADAID